MATIRIHPRGEDVSLSWRRGMQNLTGSTSDSSESLAVWRAR